MAAVDADVVESALRDVNLSSGTEIVLKPEQESAVRALLADRDVLAVLPTRYGKSLIYQMFVRAKNYELNGNAAILIISPLKSIIDDQLQEMELKNSKGTAFRKAYGELAVLRCLCKEGTPILALTGTADDTTKSTICRELSLHEDVLNIFISPHRPNIRISVTKVKKDDMDKQIDWLVEEVKEKEDTTPKTIIFCNTLKDIATVVNLLFFKLGKHATVPVGSSDVRMA
ncbi:ATP-dependent DNA helicase RecQ-like [Montipora capricornis]|uniref:ATP-dependent DNA helicase RecQ-like n=1 Tax=Montipora capricornis TaxID=246305 RepID=UPI0035F1D42F